MVAMTEKPKPVKQITQKGLMRMLYRAIEAVGGKMNFPVGGLELANNAGLKIDYNAETDSFDVQTVMVKKPVIAVPPEKRLIV